MHKFYFLIRTLLRNKLNLIFFHVAETELGMTAGSSTMSNAFTVTSTKARMSLVHLVCTSAFFLLLFLAYGSSKIWKHFKNRIMLDERTSEAKEIHYEAIHRNIFQGRQWCLNFQLFSFMNSWPHSAYIILWLTHSSQQYFTLQDTRMFFCLSI